MTEQQSVQDILTERGNRYGDFATHAEITQRLKAEMKETPNWQYLSHSQCEALEMVAHKIGRILNGDPNYTDSWIDIAGYAQLVANELELITTTPITSPTIEVQPVVSLGQVVAPAVITSPTLPTNVTPVDMIPAVTAADAIASTDSSATATTITSQPDLTPAPLAPAYDASVVKPTKGW